MRVNTLLGELLIERNFITSEQLSSALDSQKTTKEPLGQILVRLGFISEADLRKVLSEQLGVSFLASEQLIPRTDQRLKESLPVQFAREHRILPLERKGNVLKVAVSRVPDIIFLDNLRKITGLDITIVLSPESELQRAIENFYSRTDFQEMISSTEVDNVK